MSRIASRRPRGVRAAAILSRLVLPSFLLLICCCSPAFANQDIGATARVPNAAGLDFAGRYETALGLGAPRPHYLTIGLREVRARNAARQHREEERKCLATAIYFEARGESQGGQAAVAQVVLNRARSRRYPDSVCGVVYQGKNRRHACQFSFACDGKPDTIREPKAWALAQRIADDVLAGRRQAASVASATHYHAAYVSPYWARKMRRLTRIGQHVFYAGA